MQDEHMDKKFQPTFWASLVTVVALIILCILGSWQIKRLAWKTSLLTQIAAQKTANAQNYQKFYSDIKAQNWDKVMFHKTVVTGVFDHANAIHIYPRLYDEKQGFHVITPLQTAYGVIVVNRGWVETDHDYDKPLGTVTINGQLRKPDAKNAFTPDNDVPRNMFYWLDFGAFENKGQDKAVPHIAIYQSPSAETAKAMPYAVSLPAYIANNHMQYAFFWFAMALVLVVIYILYHMKPVAKTGRGA